MYMFSVELAQGAIDGLRPLRARDRRIVLDAIRRSLRQEPDVRTRAKKPLRGLVPPFEAVLPIWQLRVREWRVFYDTDGARRVVYVRAVRRKPAHRRTKEIL